MFQRVLVANRGEVAARVIKAVRAMGVETVALYSDADEGALWTRIADRAVRIGPPPARDSYLNIEAVVACAVDVGADAVHPGYGLLSENADFAQAVVDAGLCFVGPSPAVIRSMGDKVRAREVAAASGVPILDGAMAVRAAQAYEEAERLGYPVLVKARYGGGGRGMRIASDAPALAQALNEASREAQAAFGAAEVYLERYLPGLRHIEVQIAADRSGSVLALGDRDCSVQRRHQKLIEEAPAPDLPESIRSALHNAAIGIARTVGYEGVGTVEYLYDEKGSQYFFLEMNTRLQVEHGVTEMVIAGLDLVQMQLRIASGEMLPLSQTDISVFGHAIEVRIAAEDVAAGFLPISGRIEALSLPRGEGVRCDFGFESGDALPVDYDSLIGKILCWGPNRALARKRLIEALASFKLEGVPCTAPYLRAVCMSEAFARGPTRFVVEAVRGVASPRRVVAIPWGAGATDVAIYGGANASRLTQIAHRRLTQHIDDSRDSGIITAPMDGVVSALHVPVGARVSKGDVVVSLEAMKMEVAVRTPAAGRVSRLHAAIGDVVAVNALLVSIDSGAS